MRLLEVKTLKFVEYADEREAPRYGILSHRWQTGEVSYGDMISGNAGCRASFSKMQQFCRQCAQDGLSLAWIDTCCIDKSSSAELSEAINSMYRWYQNAFKCYVYLSDVVALDRMRPGANKGREAANSEWFERGWTLQELIAPSTLQLYDQNWHLIGTKQELSSMISEITRIPGDVLHGEDPRNYCIAQRMSWAARRKTTRIEDQAYSLMGLFNVNMPMLYGEGEKAFIRLQEEIIRYSADQSIFVWPGIISRYDKAEMYDVTYRRLEGLLATSPAAFSLCGDIVWEAGVSTQRPFSVTNLGLSVELLLRQCSMDVYEARLNCFVESDSGRKPIAIFLRQTDQDGQFVRHIHNGALTGIWEEKTREQLDVRVNVVQGQKSLSKPSKHMVMISCDGKFSINTRHFIAPRSFVPLGDYGDGVASLAVPAGVHGSWTMSLDFRFDFHFNPYVQIAFDAIQLYEPWPVTQYAIPPDSAAEFVHNPFLRRPMLIEQSIESDGTRWIFGGHRSKGLLAWITNLNLSINVQRRPFLNAQVWTIEIEKALPSIPRFLTYEDDEPFVSFPASTERLVRQAFGGLSTHNQEKPNTGDKCPICSSLLSTPITTECGHTFCQSCIRWADLSVASTGLVTISLDSEGDDYHVICPLCANVTGAAIDSDCQRRIKTTYPNLYRLSRWCLPNHQNENFPLIENLTLDIGNTHRIKHVTAPQMIHRNRHDWTFFVRPSKPDLVAEVKVTLHESFKEPVVILTNPPFEVRKFGWGMFNIRADVVLKPGYQFLHAEADQDDQFRSTLELTWLLEFDGDGGKGWMKVAVERAKSRLSEHDLKLRDQITRLRLLQGSRG